MAGRCRICLKTTSNCKQPLRVVTSDAEAKIRFGYHSIHQTPLTGTLKDTKVHKKCYEKYKDRWYNQNVRSKNLKNTIPIQNSVDVSTNSGENQTDYQLPIYSDENDYSNYNDQPLESINVQNVCSNRIPNEMTNKHLRNITNVIDIQHDEADRDLRIDSSMVFESSSMEEDELFDESLEINRMLIGSEVDIDFPFQNDDILVEKNETDARDLLATEASQADRMTIEDQSDSAEGTHLFQLNSTTQSIQFVNDSFDYDMCTPATDRSTKKYTSTPNTFSREEKMTRSRRRRPSEEALVPTIGRSDRSLIYESPLHELNAWLKSILKDGRLIPLVDVQTRYSKLLSTFDQQQSSPTNIRSDALRKQLEHTFPNQYHFETVNKRNGTYIALNDISFYTRSAINMTRHVNDTTLSDSTCSGINSSSSDKNSKEQCEIIFTAARLIRNYMKETLHIFETFIKEPEKVVDLTNDLFSDCIPKLIRNFIGFLTSSDRQFQKIEKEHSFYNIFEQDIFENSSKSLKNISISHDILNARHDHIVSPKQILLSNEICKYVRSNELLSILNRFGHTASYKTISRIHRKVAEEEMLRYSVPSGALPNCYLIQVADNFDLNRETLHGERSFHFLNRIFVQTLDNKIASDEKNVSDNSTDNSGPIETFDDDIDIISVHQENNQRNPLMVNDSVVDYVTSQFIDSE